MTCPGAENAVSFVDMKLPIAYLGGGVIVVVMFLAVFVGGANAETAFQASQQKQQLQRATTEPDSAKGLNCYRLHPWLRLT